MDKSIRRRGNWRRRTRRRSRGRCGARVPRLGSGDERTARVSARASLGRVVKCALRARSACRESTAKAHKASALDRRCDLGGLRFVSARRERQDPRLAASAGCAAHDESRAGAWESWHSNPRGVPARLFAHVEEIKISERVQGVSLFCTCTSHARRTRSVFGRERLFFSVGGLSTCSRGTPSRSSRLDSRSRIFYIRAPPPLCPAPPPSPVFARALHAAAASRAALAPAIFSSIFARRSSESSNASIALT